MSDEDFRSFAVAERIPIHVTLQRSGQEVYCTRCHLATPAWRNRCIHCSEPLQRSHYESRHQEPRIKRVKPISPQMSAVGNQSTVNVEPD
jgi:hypothetical protein